MQWCKHQTSGLPSIKRLNLCYQQKGRLVDFSDHCFRREMLIKWFRIRHTVRETSEVTHRTIFCKKIEAETNMSFENTFLTWPSVCAVMNGKISQVMCSRVTWRNWRPQNRIDKINKKQSSFRDSVPHGPSKTYVGTWNVLVKPTAWTAEGRTDERR